MSVTFNFVKDKKEKVENIVVLNFAEVQPDLSVLSKDAMLYVEHALGVCGQYKAALGETVDFILPEKVTEKRVFVLGLGKKSEFNHMKAEEAGGIFYTFLKKAGVEECTISVRGDFSGFDFMAEDVASAIASGLYLRSYNFDKYKSKADEELPSLKSVDFVCEHSAHAKGLFDDFKAIGQGVYQARDLVNMPPNDLYPDAYAKLIKDELKPLGVEVEIFDEKKLAKMGAGAITAVGQGSDRPPRMVVMSWNGGKGGADPIAFVGKGVTFDTGGISIKPAAGMDEMKMDMGGSAAVVGLMKTLALRGAKANVVGIVGLAENMPSAKAYRPGDIIKSYAGKTVEVLNTDAEGRLVLADCLSFVQKIHKPSMVIDLATLTGAMMVALGHEYCGTFVNDESLWKQMEQSSARSGEKLWRMPLDEALSKQVESDVADLQNIGKVGRWAGACTAAAFLQAFIEGDTKWAHMDIAGTAWRKTDQPTVPKFGTGFGVRVLNELVSHYYEG